MYQKYGFMSRNLRKKIADSYVLRLFITRILSPMLHQYFTTVNRLFITLRTQSMRAKEIRLRRLKTSLHLGTIHLGTIYGYFKLGQLISGKLISDKRFISDKFSPTPHLQTIHFHSINNSSPTTHLRQPFSRKFISRQYSSPTISIYPCLSNNLTPTIHLRQFNSAGDIFALKSCFKLEKVPPFSHFSIIV
jgi:hypothetical protein